MNAVQASETAKASVFFLHLHQVQGLLIALAIVVLLFLVSRLAKRPHGVALPRPPGVPAMRRQPQAESADKLIAADPLQAIARVRFERIRLLNPAESRLLPIIEHAAQAADSGLRVTTRTSLGDIIAPRHGCASSDDRRHACATINSRQLDFAVFDRFGLCVCAIDVQRRVHAINKPRTDQPARDAIKTEALSRAGVPLIEIAPDIQAPQLQRQLQRVLAPQPSASQHRHSAIQV